MTGAMALKPGVLQGEILINLDSETEGELYVGCAGGLDASASATYTPADYDKSWECWSLAVKGFKGGHSGMDIILYSNVIEDYLKCSNVIDFDNKSILLGSGSNMYSLGQSFTGSPTAFNKFNEVLNMIGPGVYSLKLKKEDKFI